MTSIMAPTWQIVPGSMDVVAVACDCLGVEHVSPGSWGAPVVVTCSEQDAMALRDLLDELAAGTSRYIISRISTE